MKRIQVKIGEIKAADKIEEGPWWNTMVKELNEISLECTKEL